MTRYNAGELELWRGKEKAPCPTNHHEPLLHRGRPAAPAAQLSGEAPPNCLGRTDRAAVGRASPPLVQAPCLSWPIFTQQTRCETPRQKHDLIIAAVWCSRLGEQRPLASS